MALMKYNSLNEKPIDQDLHFLQIRQKTQITSWKMYAIEKFKLPLIERKMGSVEKNDDYHYLMSLLP